MVNIEHIITLYIFETRLNILNSKQNTFALTKLLNSKFFSIFNLQFQIFKKQLAIYNQHPFFQNTGIADTTINFNLYISMPIVSKKLYQHKVLKQKTFFYYIYTISILGISFTIHVMTHTLCSSSTILYNIWISKLISFFSIQLSNLSPFVRADQSPHRNVSFKNSVFQKTFLDFFWE